MTRISIPSSLLTLTLITGLSLPAAAKSVDMVHDATSNMTVQLGFPRGALKVVPSRDKRVRVVGTVDDEVERVFFQREGDVLAVRFWPEKERKQMKANLTVELPGRLSFSGHTVSADIDVRGDLGRLELNTVSGQIHAGGGATELSVNTVSGDVELTERCPRTEVNTVSGNVKLRSVTKELAVNTVSGRSDVVGPALSKIDMTTVSGDIDVDASLIGVGPFAFSTQAADVTITVQPGARLNIDTNTFSGDVTQEARSFPDGAPLKVSTFAGDITIREKR